MKPWDIYTWEFPEADDHPAVILGTETRLASKPKINVLLCSSKRATREPAEFETVLDEADELRNSDQRGYRLFSERYGQIANLPIAS